jgi:ribosomal protein S18 acetylase RimI-like enzyme
MSPAIRPYCPSDLEALYDICLKTGDAGQDASAMYRDPRILGHVYAGPYGVLEPQSCFVAEDAHGVGAYIIGTADTHGFEMRQEKEWWPRLRESIAEAQGDDADARIARLIHHPPKTPRRINEPYPAHLHIDCLPRMQGIGLGKRLIDTWLAAMARRGAKAAHLGVGPRNARAARFYQTYGFHLIEQLPEPWNTMWFGISLAR